MNAAHVIRRAIQRVAVVFNLLFLLIACAAAPGSLVLQDETTSLVRADVEAAAAPLLARGATIAVFVVTRGDATGDDLTRRLAASGLLKDGQIAPGALALYVSYEPRYSELRAGSRWSDRLPDAGLREIRTTILNPALRDDQAGVGVQASLIAFEDRIAHVPLIERVARWVSIVVFAGFVLVIFALSPIGERIGRWWHRSPPGRFVQWLGDQTPAGRKSLERITRATRLRLEDRVEYARSWCKAARAGPNPAAATALTARLTELDQERATAMQGAQSGRRLIATLERLVSAYEALGHEAARLAPTRVPAKSKRKKGAAARSAYSAGTATAPDSSTSATSSDSSTTWDSGSSTDSGPSSDGGSW